MASGEHGQEEAMTRAVQGAVRSVADRQRSVHTKQILAAGINRD
jgi:hypothetical protein